MHMIFYNFNHLSTVVDEGGSTSYVCATGRPTAIFTVSSGATVTLLKTDHASTVWAGRSSETVLSQVFDAYGYSQGDLLPLGFNGQPMDGFTRNYLLGNGHRMYCRRLMRFSSSDGLSPFGKGGMNSYAYCGGDPVNRHDPSGRNWISRLFKKAPSAPVPPTAGELFDQVAARPFNAPYFESKASVDYWYGLQKRDQLTQDQLNILMNTRHYQINDPRVASLVEHQAIPGSMSNWQINMRSIVYSQEFESGFTSKMSSVFNMGDDGLIRFTERLARFKKHTPERWPEPINQSDADRLGSRFHVQSFRGS